MAGPVTLSIPVIGDDDDAMAAAFKYAKAGWYVIPIKYGTKHPGSVLGKGWQKQSTRDSEEIVALWAGTDHGIALHCGRSGAVVLDIDNPDAVPDVIAQHAAAAPAQQTRPDMPGRQHLVYAVPSGRHLGNGNGKLGGAWGEVRGQNGIIVVAPSHHPDGGEYRWVRTGPVPQLPDDIDALLPSADANDADSATDAQVVAFFDRHNAASNPGLLRAVANRWGERMAQGESRHNTAASLAAWAMDEAQAGVYPAREADTTLSALFMLAKTSAAHAGGRPLVSPRAAAQAWMGIRAWAIGRALSKAGERVAEIAQRAANVPTDSEILAQLAGRPKEQGGSSSAPVAEPPAATQPEAAAGVAVPVPQMPPQRRVLSMSEIRSTIPSWVWEFDGRGRMLKGGLTLFAGRPAAGKSTTARWFAAGWTNGTIAGCWEGKPVNVLYVATEEAWEHAVIPSLKAADAHPDRVKFLALGDGPDRIRVDEDKAYVLSVCEQHDIRAIVLDPLMSSLAKGTNTDKSNQVRDSLEAWVEVAEKIDGTVLGIAHLIKAPKGDVLAGINGSSAFGEVPRCAFGFAPDNEADDGTRIMSQIKNSSGVNGLNLAYTLGLQQVTVTDGSVTQMTRFVLNGTADKSVLDCLAYDASTAAGRRGEGGGECSRWLRGYLEAKGEALSLEVRSDAAEMGFGKKALEGAAKALGVVFTRTREVPSKTLWSLPGAAGEVSE